MKVKEFLKKKDIEFSFKRYFIDALGAMAQGLFASLLIGTIISTIGTQFNIPLLVEIGNFAKSAQGTAIAVAIGFVFFGGCGCCSKHTWRRRRSFSGFVCYNCSGRIRQACKQTNKA